MPGRFGDKASIGIIESGGGFLFGEPMNPGDSVFQLKYPAPFPLLLLLIYEMEIFLRTASFEAARLDSGVKEAGPDRLGGDRHDRWG
jgi:hypothetical protein